MPEPELSLNQRKLAAEAALASSGDGSGRPEYSPPRHNAILASARSFFVPPPFGWRHPTTGRKGWQPSLDLIAFGMYVKRGRYLADMTQHRLEEISGVDQGQLSRLERALAPWTKVEDLVKISTALGRALPLGYCRHSGHWGGSRRPSRPLPTPGRRRIQSASSTRIHQGRDSRRQHHIFSPLGTY